LKAGQDREIDGRFCLSSPGEYTAWTGAEGEDVTGAGEVGGSGVWSDSDANRVSAVSSGDTGGDPLGRLDGDRKGGAKTGGVGSRHGRQVEGVTLIRAESEADEASPMDSHEVNGFGCDVFGGESEIAFVLAIFVVDDDKHAAGSEIDERLRDGGEGHGTTD